MKFHMSAQRQRLLRNGQASRERDIDHVPVVKLFTPDASATWLLTELDPDDPDRAFGLCDLGLGCPELGYVSLAELAALRGPMGLPVERDMHFDADGLREMAISAPGRSASGVDNAGAILVLRGALFTDDFESGDDRRWSTAAP